MSNNNKYFELTNFKLESKVVLVRTDLNVPVSNGVVKSDFRIKAATKTIVFLLKQKAKVVLLSHFGRVKSEDDKKKYSLRFVFPLLKQQLELHFPKVSVFFSEETSGKSVFQRIKTLAPESVLLIENTRFEDLKGKLETENNKNLAFEWASWCDVFVNDAFATLHRKHASNYGITKVCLSQGKPCSIGLLVKKEITALKRITSPKEDLFVVIGGIKITDKIGVINNLLSKAKKILVGGGLSQTFLTAQGYQLGKSLIDKSEFSLAKRLLHLAGEKLVLPIDYKTAHDFVDLPPNGNFSITDFPRNEMALDIGTKTILLFLEVLKAAKLVVFCGPVGVFEFTHFNEGTYSLCRKLVSQKETFLVVGGGDSIRAFADAGCIEKVSFVSTGGTATLKFLEGEENNLPSLQLLMKKIKN